MDVMAMDLLLGVLPDNASVARFRQEGKREVSLSILPVGPSKKEAGEERIADERRNPDDGGFVDAVGGGVAGRGPCA
jgi:hypothetical protein